MAQKTAALLPVTEELLRRFGDRLRLARLRRRLPAKQVAERAGMAPMTLRSLERGGSGVTVGAYLAVMQVLGIEKDLDLLAQADPVGRELQDARLPARTGASRSGLLATTARSADRKPSSPVGDAPDPRLVRGASPRKPAPVMPEAFDRHPTEGTRDLPDEADDWVAEGGFASADALAALIDPPAPSKNEDR